MYLTKSQISERLNKDLFIRPLLQDDQIGEVSIDFRLGYDFYVSIQGRDATLNASLLGGPSPPSLRDLFSHTRRRPGETFILYPNQTIIGVTLEYLKIPNNICVLLSLRSSYSRLGLHTEALFQPGYVGCLSIELTNINKTPVKITVGARIFQGRLVETYSMSNYFSKKRKYVCQTKPKLSALHDGPDLKILKRYYDSIHQN